MLSLHRNTTCYYTDKQLVIYRDQELISTIPETSQPTCIKLVDGALFVATEQLKVKTFNLLGKCTAVRHCKSKVRYISVHPSYEYFVTCETDCTEVWDVKSRYAVQSYAESSIAKFSPDGSLLGLLTSDSLELINLIQEQVAQSFNVSLVNFAFHPIEQWLVTCSSDSVRILDLSHNYAQLHEVKVEDTSTVLFSGFNMVIVSKANVVIADVQRFGLVRYIESNHVAGSQYTIENGQLIIKWLQHSTLKSKAVDLIPKVQTATSEQSLEECQPRQSRPIQSRSTQDVTKPQNLAKKGPQASSQVRQAIQKYKKVQPKQSNVVDMSVVQQPQGSVKRKVNKGTHFAVSGANTLGISVNNTQQALEIRLAKLQQLRLGWGRSPVDALTNLIQMLQQDSVGVEVFIDMGDSLTGPFTSQSIATAANLMQVIICKSSQVDFEAASLVMKVAQCLLLPDVDGCLYDDFIFVSLQVISQMLQQYGSFIWDTMNSPVDERNVTIEERKLKCSASIKTIKAIGKEVQKLAKKFDAQPGKMGVLLRDVQKRIAQVT